MDNYNFPVIEKELRTDDGIVAPSKAIVRADTNEILSVVGKDYALIKHDDVVNNFDKAMEGRLTRKRTTLCKNGGVLFSRYEFNTQRATEVKVGDVVNFGVELFNSYDGTLPVGFVFTALRLVCTNGMIVPKTISRLAVRHRGNTNIPNIREAFERRLPAFEKTANRWREWTGITPEQMKVEDFIKTCFGTRLEKTMLEKYGSLDDKSVWGIFNMLTAYNTHEKKMRKGNEANKRIAEWQFEQKVIDRFYKYNWR